MTTPEDRTPEPDGTDASTGTDGTGSEPTRPARRTVLGAGLGALGLAAAGGAVLGGGAGAAAVAATGGDEAPSEPGDLVYPFRGTHQQGITTPAQQQMHMTAFDLTTDDREQLVALLTDWTRAAENMTAGHPVKPLRVSRSAPPDDTGETYDLGAAGLTITVGVGRSLFRTADGRDRFGLARRLPAALATEVPKMAAEDLDAAQSGGDLVVQACAEDPLVALHAIHNLTRIAFGRASVRWTQLGYGRTSATGAGQSTPRNLLGFKDGTQSLRSDQDQLLDDFVWVSPDDEGGDWLGGGSYLCARKIRMRMEVWDETSLRTQEEAIGRDKVHGAPLSGGEEHTDADFTAVGPDGSPKIPAASHIALMHPGANGGVHMLRRGYNYTDGSDHLGRLDAGLFFIAFVRDPRKHFTPVLARMREDLLTEYLQHRTNSVFAMLPGLGEDETYLGERLLRR